MLSQHVRTFALLYTVPASVTFSAIEQDEALELWIVIGIDSSFTAPEAQPLQNHSPAPLAPLLAVTGIDSPFTEAASRRASPPKS